MNLGLRRGLSFQNKPTTRSTIPKPLECRLYDVEYERDDEPHACADYQNVVCLTEVDQFELHLNEETRFLLHSL